MAKKPARKPIAKAPEPVKKPAANKAKPPRPVKKLDVKDIDRADAEGMAQPQGLKPKPKKSAVSRGRKR